MTSRWTFTVVEGARHAPMRVVQEGVTRFVKDVFHLPFGDLRLTEQRREQSGWRYIIEVDVEDGTPDDPMFVEHIRTRFRHFVIKGWGARVTSEVEVEILDVRPLQTLLVKPVGLDTPS